MSPTLFRGLSRDNILASLKVVASSGVATPEAAHLVDVGSDAYLDLLEKEFLQASSDTVTSTVRIFEGASGSGKTHLLELLRRKAVAAGYATVRTTLSESLHLEDFKLISRHILENIEGKVNGALVRSLPDLLSRAGAAGRVRTAELESYQAPHPGFKAACHYAAEFPLDHPDFSHLRRFLLGERISGAALSSSGIKYVKNPLSERNAERVIRTVCSVLQFAGFRGLALLFDENERTLVVSRGTPSMRVRKTANLLRRMIDSCVNGEMPRTVVVFTVLPAFLENAKQYLDALGTRTDLFRDMYTGQSPRSLIKPGWRFPVQEVSRTIFPLTGDQWIEGATRRYREILEFLGIDSGEHAKALSAVAAEATKRSAGDSVRRSVQKGLAEHTLRVIRKSRGDDDEEYDEEE